jgi:hypothetical protein
MCKSSFLSVRLLRSHFYQLFVLQRDLDNSFVTDLMASYSVFSGLYFGVLWTIYGYLFECHMHELSVDRVLAKYEDYVDLGSHCTFKWLIESCQFVLVAMSSDEQVNELVAF